MPVIKFLEKYFAAVTQSASTGDIQPMRALTGPRCPHCRKIERSLRQTYADGGRIEGFDWMMNKIYPVERRSDRQEWHLQVRTKEERWYDGSGKLIKTVRPVLRRFWVNLRMRNPQQIIDLEVIEVVPRFR